MPDTTKNPLRALITFWQIKPKGLVGWHADTCTVLDIDLEEEICKRLTLDSKMARCIWFGKIHNLPENFLAELEKHGMNREKVIKAYAEWRHHHVVKPTMAKKVREEQAKQDAIDKAKAQVEQGVKDFKDDWK